MTDSWDRFWMWLFRKLMPPWDYLLPYKVTMQELRWKFGDALGPTMAQAAANLREFANAIQQIDDA